MVDMEDAVPRGGSNFYNKHLHSTQLQLASSQSMPEALLDSRNAPCNAQGESMAADTGGQGTGLGISTADAPAQATK